MWNSIVSVPDHCLFVLLFTKFEISRHRLFSVTEQAGLCLTWSNMSEGRFSQGVVHIILSIFDFPTPFLLCDSDDEDMPHAN